MKIVVIGGTGLIGSKVVKKLAEDGHESVAASPNSGVNTVTGEGLDEVLVGAQVVVDVSNAPDWDDDAVMEFFQRSSLNLLAAEAAAGVAHHVALSVVGTERLTESGYFRAKVAQEELIRGSSIPYSIVHATQFFEFVKSIADAATDGNAVRLPPALIQPMAADDVAGEVARVAVGPPLYATVEIAGPEQFRLDELIRERLTATGDPREVITDPQAAYFGITPGERTLLPGADARIAETRLERLVEGDRGREVAGSAVAPPASVGGAATTAPRDPARLARRFATARSAWAVPARRGTPGRRRGSSRAPAR